MNEDGHKRASAENRDRNSNFCCYGESSSHVGRRRILGISPTASSLPDPKGEISDLSASHSPAGSTQRSIDGFETRVSAAPIVGWCSCCCFGFKRLTKLRRRRSEEAKCWDTSAQGLRRRSASAANSVHNFDAATALKERDVFATKYKIKRGHVKGKPHIRYAKNIYSGQRVVLKFYNSLVCFENCKHLHAKLKSRHICRLVDVLEANDHFPPCLVFERGDFTLEEWMSAANHHPVDQKAVLFHILEALAFLHDKEIVHGDLKPNNIMYFSTDKSWKILDLDTAASIYDMMPISCTLFYAAPEVAKAIEQERSKRLDTSADTWSFGIIAFEVLTGRRFYGSRATINDVKRFLFSEHTSLSLECIDERPARKLVRKLLQKDPIERPSARTALRSAVFKSAEDSSETAHALRKIQENLERNLQISRSVRDEVSLPNVSAALSIEGFVADDIDRPFDERRGREVVTMVDSDLQGEPIFLLNLGKDYRIRISLQHRHLNRLPFQSVARIAVKAPDGEERSLDVTSFVGNSSIEAVALLEPAKLASQIFCVRSPMCGSLEQKYARLTVLVGLVIDSAHNDVVEMKETIYCRMHDASDPLWAPRFFRSMEKKWIQSPQWVKSTINAINASSNVMGLAASPLF